LGALHGLWERYGDRVAFCVVYIREAHPEDGWVLNVNRDQDIRVYDPATDDERHDVATACALRLQVRMPVVVDNVDDRIASAYGALPDRLYLIGKGGRVAFQGGPGPFGFRPMELEQAIESELERLG
jgi:hypothetical protein